VPEAKAVVMEILKQDGTPTQGLLRLLMDPAEVDLDGRTAATDSAKVLGECVQALEVRWFEPGFRSPRLSLHRRKAATALAMSSRKVQERAVWPKTVSSAAVITDVRNDEARCRLRLPHRLQPRAASDVDPLAHIVLCVLAYVRRAVPKAMITTSFSCGRCARSSPASHECQPYAPRPNEVRHPGTGRDQA
jgi:hypothetical protein